MAVVCCKLTPFLSLMQTAFRARAARRDFEQSVYAVKRVQALWRGRTARTRFDHLRRLEAALVVQVFWGGGILEGGCCMSGRRA